MGRWLCEIIVERRPYRLPAKLRHSAATLAIGITCMAAQMT
jgi:hypothetical protein